MLNSQGIFCAAKTFGFFRRHMVFVGLTDPGSLILMSADYLFSLQIVAMGRRIFVVECDKWVTTATMPN
jgi:hypothetical protein